MKAITLWQPWASLIAVGAKKFETRSWGTKYRGRIAIHAGKAKKQPPPEVLKVMAELGLKMDELPYGQVICTADLTDCIKLDTPTILEMFTYLDYPEVYVGDWDLGRYAWQLAEIRVLDKPMPVKGAQRLWEMDNEILHEGFGWHPRDFTDDMPERTVTAII